MSTKNPAITYVESAPLASLKLDSRNPRKHTQRQIKQIARSIKSFGLLVPPLVDRDGNILAGHGRVLAAKSLGLQAIQVLRAENLTEAQAKAFRIADNRLAEKSTWDDKLLGEVLGELATLELNFSLEDTGFSMGEIDLRIEGVGIPSLTSDPADEFPLHSGQPAVTKLGDLWKLGRHSVLCGDAIEDASFRSLMQGKHAQIVFADMPYNVPVFGHVTGKGRIKHREFAMAVGEMNEDQFTRFMSTAMRLLVAHSGNGSLHYFSMDWRHAMEILTAGKQIYTELKNLCIWTKTTAGMGALYRSQHELIFVFKNGKGKHRNNIELGAHGRNRTNVWQYPSPASFGATGEEGKLLALHPTVKPVAMIADALLDASARGDIVLDPFIGSGSTLIAAERVGRICYGMDLDPLYVDTAIRRWQRHTGEHAIDAATGKRFETLAYPSKVRRGKAA